MIDKLVQTFLAIVPAALAASLVTLVIGLGLVTQCAPVRDPIPRALAESRLAEEEAIATTLGFVREREEEVSGEGPIVRALTLGRGECVAALAGFFGGSAPGSVAIVPRGGTHDRPRAADVLAVHSDIDGLVGHVEWCADRDIDVEVVIRVWREGETMPSAIVRLLRVPASVGLTNERLLRGTVLLDPVTVLGGLDARATDPEPSDAAGPETGSDR